MISCDSFFCYNYCMSWLKNFKEKFGPGIITGASDDDPAGILTYLQAGVVLGLSSLWTALLTLPLMYSVQEMCARIGLVTGHGLIHLIKKRYGRLLLWSIALISTIVITINIGADLLAIGVVMEKFTDLSRLIWLVLGAGVILSATIFFSYRMFARILKWLTFSLFFYVATVLYLNIDWSSALVSTIWPIHFQFNQTSLFLLAAIVGTTISPYLFFWQAEEEVEEKSSRRIFFVTKHELKDLKEDTFLGMLFSNGVMWFLILAAAQLAKLYGLGVIENFDQAALALKPLLGNAAFLMFGLGIIGTGMLAIPVLAGSIGYMWAEVFNWREGLNKIFRKAPAFYWVIILATAVGVALSFSGLDPVKLLVYTGVLYALITPPLIIIILHLANDKKVMGHKTNSRVSNILGWFSALVIMVLVLYLLFGKVFA